MNQSANEKAKMHLDALPQRRSRGGHSSVLKWEQDGISFSIYDPSITESGNGIEVTIEASDENGVLPLDNPYRFFNPPIGTVVGYYGDGEPIIDTTDPTIALKQIVYDAVTLVAKQRGWNP